MDTPGITETDSISEARARDSGLKGDANEAVLDSSNYLINSVSPAAKTAAYLTFLRVALLFLVNLIGDPVVYAKNQTDAKVNEDIKTELYGYIEYKPQTVGVVSRVGQMIDGNFALIYSGTASSSGEWLRSNIFKIGGSEIVINAAYLFPALICDNIEQYRIHMVPSPGYEVYFRNYQTSDPFQAKSVFAETPASAVVREVAVLPSSQQGASPGKTTVQDVGDGHLRLALGFLANGKSAGYIDFSPRIHSVKGADPANSSKLKVEYGRPPGGADLSTISTSTEVEVVQIPVPQFAISPGRIQPATVAMRQVVSPQTIVDVSRVGFKTVIKFYSPQQKGSRKTTEPNPYGGPAVDYAGKGPYEFTGSPFVS